MSELITYIILFPLVVLLCYATFDFIFWNKVKKISFLWFSVERQLKSDDNKLEKEKKSNRNKKYKVKNSLKSWP